ncbi:MAG: anti-sigma factor [Saprospiraceae bacterium]
MTEDIKQFLASSLLEEYVLGSIDPARIPEVEHYILHSPTVKAAYEELQDNIALLAQKVATPPPPGTKENILREIDQTIVSTATAATKTTDYRNWGILGLTIVGIALGAWTALLYQENKTLQKDKLRLEEQYATLQNQCDAKKEIYAQQEAEWMILADAQTQKFLINGNDKATSLKTVAYRNAARQSAYLRILSLPTLPKGKCLQLWGDVNGEMVSLKILPNSAGQTIAIPYQQEATSLNITIEPAGGSPHPTLAKLIASVAI